MLDLETMGNGVNAAIIAIGAVRFTNEIKDKFYETIDLRSSVELGLDMDPETVLWWMQQCEDARAQFKQKGKQIQSVLVRFTQWIGDDAVMWGNGADFDNAILANAYKKCHLEQPWKFWNNRCYRTVKNMYPNIEMVRTGTHHNAVDDAESQALHLLHILAR